MFIASDPAGAPMPAERSTPRAAAPRTGEYDAAALLLDAGLHAEWDRLVARGAEASAFAERWFMLAGVRHLAPPDSFRMVAVRDGDGALAGLFPLCLATPYGRLPLRHVQNWLHYHSFLGTPLIRAGYEAAAWGAVLDHLDGAGWPRGLLHINGLIEDGAVHRGLVRAAAERHRACDVVHRMQRALLHSDLTPQAYYETTIRKKKRKELGRLRKRLEEQGALALRMLGEDEAVEPWCDAFLRLEGSGWKGRAGSALASQPHTAAFFREVIAGARAAGRLQFLALELDGRPIAMLANLLTPPGSFSFKIAFDETYARFSPGVLIEIENLQILERPEIVWMDSCAVADHSMINSLWAQRREIVRVTLPLGGRRRRALFHACRAAERASAMVKRVARRRGKAGA